MVWRLLATAFHHHLFSRFGQQPEVLGPSFGRAQYPSPRSMGAEKMWVMTRFQRPVHFSNRLSSDCR